MRRAEERERERGSNDARLGRQASGRAYSTNEWPLKIFFSFYVYVCVIEWTEENGEKGRANDFVGIEAAN